MARGRWLIAGLMALLAAGVALRGGVTPGGAAALHAAAGVLGLAVALRGRRPAAPGSALALAIAWTGLALASVLWSRSADASLDAAAAIAAAGVVFLVATLLPDATARRELAGSFAVLGAVVAGLAVGAVALGERADFPFGNPNHLAAWLLLPAGIGFAASASRESVRRGRREDGLLWFGLVAITGAGIAATRSVGAGLAVAAGLGGYLALSWLGARRGVVLAALGFVATAIALTLLPAAWPGWVPAEAAGAESSPGLRWAVWGASARAAWEAGPLGVGAGAFPAAFLGERPSGVPYAARHAHSEPLHGLVELGLPFLVLALATGVVAVRSVGRRLARGASRTTWGAVTALLALAAHSLVDFPLHIPAVALAAAALAGPLWPRPRGAGGWGTRAGLAALSLTALVLAGTQGGAVWSEREASLRLARGDFAGAVASAERGLRLRPARGGLHAVLARAAEHEWRFAGGGVARRELAVSTLVRAVALAPADAKLRVTRARLRARSGDGEGALEDLSTAAVLDPRSPVPHLAMARLHLDRGAPDPALGSLRDALERHPRVVDPGLRALLVATGEPALVRASLPRDARGHRAAASLFSEHGFLRAAAEEYARAHAAAPEDVESALRAASYFERARDATAARAVLLRALERAPAEPRLRDRLARLHARGTAADASAAGKGSGGGGAG